MWIMIAGPYTHGSKDQEVWKRNHIYMNEFAYEVYKKGHVPIIGVNAALPIIEAVGFDKFEELMMPISLEVAQRCDAILRVGGASNGADKEVAVFQRKGLPVYYSLEEIPNIHQDEES
ncbi:MAG TPA: DUF4406 domain-containing protein [Microscillaceae bacterium]|nr:DUF4406 domain-containing protein [Microscillaceae bacterium]